MYRRAAAFCICGTPLEQGTGLRARAGSSLALESSPQTQNKQQNDIVLETIWRIIERAVGMDWGGDLSLRFVLDTITLSRDGLIKWEDAVEAGSRNG